MWHQKSPSCNQYCWLPQSQQLSWLTISFLTTHWMFQPIHYGDCLSPNNNGDCLSPNNNGDCLCPDNYGDSLSPDNYGDCLSPYTTHYKSLAVPWASSCLGPPLPVECVLPIWYLLWWVANPLQQSVGNDHAFMQPWLQNKAAWYLIWVDFTSLYPFSYQQ